MYKFKISDPHFLPHAACEVEIQLQAGEILTIVGENGIGKSTLMQRLWQSGYKSMTFVEQKPLDIFYDRSLKKIKDVMLTARRGKIDEEFFFSMWKRFNLAAKEDRILSSLSGGEAQALKICLTLSQESNCYLLDEPSQFLDVAMKKVLSGIITELQSKQKTILLVEHDVDWIKSPARFLQIGMVEGKLREVRTWTI